MIPSQPVASVLGALIAAVIAIIGIVFARSQKAAELKNSWMDKLCDNVSEFMSCIECIVSLRHENNNSPAAHSLEAPYFDRGNKAVVRIGLTLRLMREDYKSTKTCLGRILVNMSNNTINTKQYQEDIDELNELMAKVMRNEWRKISFGSTLSNIVLVASAIIAILAIMTLLVQASNLPAAAA